MKRLLPVLLLLPAVLIGLFLPALQVRIQARQDAGAEASGIEAVDLRVSSNLSVLEKLALFSDDTASAAVVAEGQYQTAESAAARGRDCLNALLFGSTEEDADMTADLVQMSSRVYLLTAGSDLLLLWQIAYWSDTGEQITIWLDDETGALLSMQAYVAEPSDYAPFNWEDVSDYDPLIAHFSDMLGMKWWFDGYWESDDALGSVGIDLTLSAENETLPLQLWVDSSGVYLNWPRFSY